MEFKTDTTLEKKYILYVKNKCPFCVKAKQLLVQKNVLFETISFDTRPKVLQEIKNIYDWKTVPMVFERVETKTYKLLGGYTDLVERLEKGI